MVTTSGWTATYVGRIGAHTGESAADWLASVPTGTGSSTVLGTNSTQFAGQSLNNIGGANDWAPEMSVQINDGNVQRSQVGYLVLTFNEPVTIGTTNLNSVFAIKDGSGNLLNLSITSNGTVSENSLMNVTEVVITFLSSDSDTFNFATKTTVGSSSTPGGRNP